MKTGASLVVWNSLDKTVALLWPNGMEPSAVLDSVLQMLHHLFGQTPAPRLAK